MYRFVKLFLVSLDLNRVLLAEITYKERPGQKQIDYANSN
jgi:hypothetical protein